jgi:hypothetical protein
MGKSLRSDFLFAQPNILFGLARFFDFAGVFDDYNRTRNESEADGRATFADWYITGEDLGLALERVKDDPSLCRGDPNQLSLFSVSSKSEITRELQKTA